MRRQLHQGRKGAIATCAGVWPLLLELPVSEAVLLEVLLGFKGFYAAAALVRSFLSVSPQVVL